MHQDPPYLQRRYGIRWLRCEKLFKVKGETTITEIASEFRVHPNQIRQWRAQPLERLPEMFSQRKSQNEKSQDELVAELFRRFEDPEIDGIRV